MSGQYNALVQDIVGEAMRSVGSGWDMANEELITKVQSHGPRRQAPRRCPPHDGS
jgi:hypothetical protein